MRNLRPKGRTLAARNFWAGSQFARAPVAARGREWAQAQAGSSQWRGYLFQQGWTVFFCTCLFDRVRLRYEIYFLLSSVYNCCSIVDGCYWLWLRTNCGFGSRGLMRSIDRCRVYRTAACLLRWYPCTSFRESSVPVSSDFEQDHTHSRTVVRSGRVYGSGFGTDNSNLSLQEHTAMPTPAIPTTGISVGKRYRG